jgi:hypothetical protein
MTGSEALTLVDTLLLASEPCQRLNDTQSAVFLEIWAGCSYQEIADRQGYEIDYIKQIAARLWKNIGQAVGEKVSKSNLQTVLQRYQVSHPHQRSVQDWGEAIDVSIFYGRQTDLQTLETWTLSLRCKTIGIFGLGGMGKTSLSVKLAQQVQAEFDVVISTSATSGVITQRNLAAFDRLPASRKFHCLTDGTVANQTLFAHPR